MIDELAEFLRLVSVDGETPHVAGNSLGGYLALELARRGHAASATAFNPAGFFHGPWDQRRTVAQFLALRGVGRTVALVPTMGALHSGHLELVRQAKLTGAVVVVSIFVNPLQFGAGEALDAYPRTFDEDCAALAELGVPLVFAPTVSAMYPNGPRTTVHPGPAGRDLEAAQRPTHFSGMLTVVSKLLNIAAPTAGESKASAMCMSNTSHTEIATQAEPLRGFDRLRGNPY